MQMFMVIFPCRKDYDGKERFIKIFPFLINF